MKVRAADLSDVQAIAALERAAFGVDAYPGVFIRQAIELWPGQILVASEESVQGYALAAPSLSPEEAWILSIAVGWKVRRRGVGTALLTALVEKLRGGGIRRVSLTVHPDNEQALRLYESLGFVVDREDPDYFGPGEPRLRLALPLHPGPRHA